jgi:hypothetical protein
MKKYNRLILGLVISFLMMATLLSAAPIKPIAGFEFEKSEYQQNEPIEVLDTSYSKNGKKITQREWMLVANQKKRTGSNVSVFLKNLEPGNYEVFLRVKDQSGIWSDWSSRKLKIKKSQPITVTTFKVERASYAIGEKIEYSYTYNNPNELKVRSQKWTYKNLVTGLKVAGKPKYFKKSGKYEISMQVQDEWGNWSPLKTCIVQIGTQTIERNGTYLFTKGKQGDLLEGYIDKDYHTFDLAKNIETKDVKGKLIVSNSPERIESSGILYRDTMQGKTRLLVHHQNALPLNKKLVVAVKSNEDREVRIQTFNQAIQGPHKDILGTGQMALREYLQGKNKKEYTLRPGEVLYIYDSTSAGSWLKEEVISGLMDLESDGEVTLTVAAMDYNSPIKNLSGLQVLKRNGHIRGTFDVIERYYRIDLSQIDKPTKFVVGGSGEEWVTGTDALTGEVVKNIGNYGVSAFIQIENEEDMGIILNARGGGYQGSIKWGNGRVFDVPREEILSDKKIATLVGVVKAHEANQFVYMLPNGSAAPVLFGFIPKRMWDKE